MVTTLIIFNLSPYNVKEELNIYGQVIYSGKLFCEVTYFYLQTRTLTIMFLKILKKPAQFFLLRNYQWKCLYELFLFR